MRKEIKLAAKVALVRACWFVFPPLGTTVNEYLGGGEVTGLWGNYEMRRPVPYPFPKADGFWKPRPNRESMP